jgi:hypothetical protein
MADKKKPPPEEPSDLSTDSPDDEEAGGVHVFKGKALDALVITKGMIDVADDEIEVEDKNLKTKQQKKRAETVALAVESGSL